jgi:hypothetical protein
LAGAATFALFYAGGQIVLRHPSLRRVIGNVFRYADAGSTPLVVLIAASSGVAEELYFRGGRRRNPALVLADLITRVVFGWQREATGGYSPRPWHTSPGRSSCSE